MSNLTREIIEIGATVPQAEKKVRIAAYARVSSDSEEQLHSFTTQVKYYTELVKEKESWSWVGIYADEGISGISTTKLNSPRILSEMGRRIKETGESKQEIGISTKSRCCHERKLKLALKLFKTETEFY